MKNIVICMGPGRSGTSLAMSILAKLGMRTSDVNIAPSEHNPPGTWEDKFIFERNTKIFKLINRQYELPIPPTELLTNPDVLNIAQELKEYIKNNVQSTDTIWGIKDPRISLVLPLWDNIFKSLDIVPKYILCMRAPQNTLASYSKYYSIAKSRGEKIWLGRTLSCLTATKGNCFILHYEDWFSNQNLEVAKDLRNYIGLQKKLSDDAISKIINETFNHSLNRAKAETATDIIEDVSSTYQLLKDIRGTDFDKEKLTFHSTIILDKLDHQAMLSKLNSSLKPAVNKNSEPSLFSSNLDDLSTSPDLNKQSTIALESKHNHSLHIIDSLNETISSRNTEILKY